jgi:hypothetical protein
MAGMPPHSRSMPDLSLAADALSDTGDDLDAFHPPISPSPPPRSRSPSPPRATSARPLRPDGMQHKLSSEALRRHELMVRRTSSRGILSLAGEGQVKARDHAAEARGAGSPTSERSYSESAAGSIHSAARRAFRRRGGRRGGAELTHLVEPCRFTSRQRLFSGSRRRRRVHKREETEKRTA